MARNQSEKVATTDSEESQRYLLLYLELRDYRHSHRLDTVGNIMRVDAARKAAWAKVPEAERRVIRQMDLYERRAAIVDIPR